MARYQILTSTTTDQLDAATEAELVQLAQLGDEAAAMQLVNAYAPALRNALARHHEALDPEDAEQEVILALLTLVQKHDPSTGRLAGRVAVYVKDALLEATGATNPWGIPPRTLKRYFAILRKAGGDTTEAARIAPDNDMATTTFLDLAAILSTDSLDAASDTEHEGAGRARIERAVAVGADEERDPFDVLADEELVAQAFAAVSHDESTVVRQAYGFEPAIVDGTELLPEGHAPLSDQLVAISTGLSRPKVQRTRTSALAKMRAALVVEEVAA